jgi:hypothetical protein
MDDQSDRGGHGMINGNILPKRCRGRRAVGTFRAVHMISPLWRGKLSLCFALCGKRRPGGRRDHDLDDVFRPHAEINAALLIGIGDAIWPLNGDPAFEDIRWLQMNLDRFKIVRCSCGCVRG